MAKASRELILVWVSRSAPHPFDAVDCLNPRRGMRRWMLHPSHGGVVRWDEAWFGLHDYGAISLVCAIGGRRVGGAQPGTRPGGRIRSVHIEAAVADAMALLREATRATGATGEYDVHLGIEWAGEERLLIETTDGQGFPFDGTSVPLGSFATVRSSVRADLDSDAYLAQVSSIASDAINQGGVQHLQALWVP